MILFKNDETPQLKPLKRITRNKKLTNKESNKYKEIIKKSDE